MPSRTVQLFSTPHMSGELLITDDGLFPKVTTAPAAVVLPYQFRATGKSDFERTSVVLYRRQRPEFGETTPIPKTVGAYLKKGETPEACAKRALRDRLGIAPPEALEDIGIVLGYTSAKIQTTCFLAQSWSIVTEDDQTPQRFIIPLRRALDLVQQKYVLDDATAIPIMWLALRVLGV